jgi:hypothetical protein
MSAEELEDSNYPFDTGDWDSWTSVQQRDWLRNLVYQLTKDDNSFARELEIPDEEIRQFQESLAILEKAVAAEEAERKAYAKLLRSQHELTAAIQSINSADKRDSKQIQPLPDLKPGKKGH